jgi:dTDP-4-amino-4,6-dideoxygalactose transaminase
MGERVNEFEFEFAKYHGVKHAIAVNNCTAALHLAYSALGFQEKDEVICPSLTFVATSNAVLYSGAIPIFTDIASVHDWNIGLDSINDCITSNTKGIVVVHYAGYPCDMEAICKFARDKGLKIVEDCAHAPGAFYKGRALGSWGDAGCFSFFSNKNMSTGEGGMVITNNDSLADKIRLLRSHGMTTITLDRHKGHAFSYDVETAGYNYRPTEITAALGITQLKKLAKNKDRRKKIVQHYRNLLFEESEKVLVPFSNVDLNTSACHIMPIMLLGHINQKNIMKKMKEKGIQTSIHYPPVHMFKAYQWLRSKTDLPLTERISKACLTLPLFPEMTIQDVEFCVRSLIECIGES